MYMKEEEKEEHGGFVDDQDLVAWLKTIQNPHFALLVFDTEITDEHMMKW